jgi:hypothetical protein
VLIEKRKRLIIKCLLSSRRDNDNNYKKKQIKKKKGVTRWGLLNCFAGQKKSEGGVGKSVPSIDIVYVYG